MSDLLLKGQVLSELYVIQDRPVSTAMKIIRELPTIDLVMCGECKWYDKPHIKYNDGTRKDVEEDELWVTSDVGINVGGRCKNHIDLKIYCLNHNREDPEDYQRLVIFRHPTDFCSYGERANATQHTQHVESVGERRTE